VIQGPDEPHQDGADADDPEDNQKVSHVAIVTPPAFTESESGPFDLKNS
jgi:hypothetical protein